MEANSLGAHFISTMFCSADLIKTANDQNLSILCGVSNLNDARRALQYGAHALKFFTVDDVPPLLLSTITETLRNEGLLITADGVKVDTFVAGGVQEKHLNSYLSISPSLTGFVVGFDCQQLPPIQIRKQLKEMNKLIKELRKT